LRNVLGAAAELRFPGSPHEGSRPRCLDRYVYVDSPARRNAFLEALLPLDWERPPLSHKWFGYLARIRGLSTPGW